MAVETEVVHSVTSTVRYNCGCGFSTRVAADAFEHVLAKQHVLVAYGFIGPAERIREIAPTTRG